MSHLPQLIIDLSYILATAAIVAVFFRIIKQPIILGYLLAGLLLGPHVGIMPTVRDVTSISIWAEIGVIFVLFSIGLEFSFKKLANIGSKALTTGLMEVHLMLGLGFILGKIFGWSAVNAIFLGGILSISSTAVVIKSFEELNIKGKDFAPLVVGVLIVEDVFAVLLMVVLPTISITKSLSGLDLIMSISKLIFFITLCFIIGLLIVPWFLKKVRNSLSDELTLILCLGLCFVMVLIAAETGFSPALGAFVMGSILADTKEGRKVEHRVKPIKELFSAIFFVSVGMLIDPMFMLNNWSIIAIVCIVTILGKITGNILGSLLAGTRLETAIGTGFSLAQIGEFSFIIATLGISLGIIDKGLYSIAVAVSVVTTFITPILIKNIEPFYSFLLGRLPEQTRELMKDYRFAMKWQNGESTFGLLFSAYAGKIFFNSVVIVALNLTLRKTALIYLRNEFGYQVWITVLVAAAFLILSSPFLWAITHSLPSQEKQQDQVLMDKLEQLKFGSKTIRFLFGLTLVMVLSGQFSSLSNTDGFIVALLTILITFLCHFSAPLYNKFEQHFFSQLDENEEI